MKAWNLNCDVGEGAGNDARLMPYLDACSIACGGHAGDAQSMQETVQLAQKHGVSIGAHPSFPDRGNFGREPMEMTPEALTGTLRSQIDSLQAICRQMGARLAHVKPHGALYHLACTGEPVARAILKAMGHYPGLTLFAPWKSIISQLAPECGISVTLEAFADRRYHRDLSLVSRKDPHGVISEPKEAMDQVNSIWSHGQVMTVENEVVALQADTFCVHGDNPSALAILSSLKSIEP